VSFPTANADLVFVQIVSEEAERGHCKEGFQQLQEGSVLERFEANPNKLWRGKKTDRKAE
jgi:hypothetical protein